MKEKLLARAIDIESQMHRNRMLVQQHNNMVNQLNADYHAMDGALQEIRRWVEESDKENVVQEKTL